MEPVEQILKAFENFSCDDSQLVKLTKDTLRALDKDLEEGSYEASNLAEKTYEELDEYLEELNSYEEDDEDDDDDDTDGFRDIDDD